MYCSLFDVNFRWRLYRTARKESSGLFRGWSAYRAGRYAEKSMVEEALAVVG